MRSKTKMTARKIKKRVKTVEKIVEINPLENLRSLSNVTPEALMIIRQALLKYHEVLRAVVTSLSARVKSGELSMELLADIGFVMKQVEEMCDGTRKDAGYCSILAQECAITRWITEPGNDDGTSRPIRGKLTVATPKMYCKILMPTPNGDREAWDTLMRHIGLSESAIAMNVLQINYPAMCEKISADIASGLPPPPGIDPGKIGTKFKLSFRERCETK